MNKTYLPMPVSPVSSIENYKTIRMQKIYDYVDRNYMRIFPLKEIADIVGLAVPSFCNFFKEQTGITFISYLQHYRVEMACLLLEDVSFDILDIVTRCGFCHQPYFTRIFFRYKGKTPFAYRKQLISCKNNIVEPLTFESVD